MANDDWRTPGWLRKIFARWDDPCPPGGTGGLERTWESPAFVNPPYSDPLPWVRKAIAESRRGVFVVLLLKHDSSTEAWRLLHEEGAHFAAFIGRLHYSESRRSPPFPSVLVILDGER